MSKKIFNINDIKKNIENIKKKINNKQINNDFWVIVDRVDFKPLVKNNVNNTNVNNVKSKKQKFKTKTKTKTKTKSKTKTKTKTKNIINKTKNDKIIHSISEIKKFYLGEKKEYYFNKKFACIKLSFNKKTIDDINDIKYSNYDKTIIFTICINIYMITENGDMNYDKNNHWNTCVHITINDLRIFKLKLKTIEIVARIVAEKNNIKNKVFYSELFHEK